MVLSIEMDPADRDINIERPSLKSMPPVSLPIRTLQNYTPPRTVVGHYERTVQVRYANGEKLGELLLVPMAQQETLPRNFQLREKSLFQLARRTAVLDQPSKATVPFIFTEYTNTYTHACTMYTFMKYLVYSRIGTSVCSF
jgi:hypothetical protein